MAETRGTVDELIEIITRKLRENRPTLQKSLRFGRLTWREKKPGVVEVDLELKL